MAAITRRIDQGGGVGGPHDVAAPEIAMEQRWALLVADGQNCGKEPLEGTPTRAGWDQRPGGCQLQLGAETSVPPEISPGPSLFVRLVQRSDEPCGRPPPLA